MSASNHTDFYPHVKPAAGVSALARRLRGRWARRRLRRYRLQAHRTDHPAGHQPAERRALKVPAEAARRALAPTCQEVTVENDPVESSARAVPPRS